MVRTDGVLAVDKPSGLSSREVVNRVGRAVGLRTVGHAGTLDPLATGVVVVCIGKATKLVDFIHELPKSYRGVFLLGRSSPSDDIETDVTPETDPVQPTVAAIEAAAQTQRGEINQRPCDYSAKQVAGQRAYRLARQGKPVVLQNKLVRIDRLEVVSYDWPRLELEVDCSTGTFIRAIGRDLAAVAGTTAVMEQLVRTSVGPFSIAASLPLAAVTPDAAGRHAVLTALQPPQAAVPQLPRQLLDEAALAAAAAGGLLQLAATAEAIVGITADARMAGILRRLPAGGYRLKPNFMAQSD